MSAPARKFPAPCWTHDETVALIDAYREKWYSLRRGNLRAADWDAVSAAVSLRCHLAAPSKTSVQCRHKIEKLRQRYRAEKQRCVAYPGGFCSSWVFFANMDSMEHGSNQSQTSDDPNPNFDFDGNKFHLKSSPNPGFDEEEGCGLKSVGDGSLVPPGPRANNCGKINGYSNINLVSDAGGGFLVKAPVGRNLESLELKSKVYSNSDGNVKAKLDFNHYDDDRMDAGRRFRLKMQGVEDMILSGIRSKNYGMIDGNSNSNLSDDINGDGFWMKNPRGRNYAHSNSNPKLDSRVLNGRSGSLRLGFGKESGVRGIKRETDPISEMVSSIRLLGEGFVKMEKMKMDMAREIEKMRMEMEMKRSEMLLESQQQIVDTFMKGFLEKKKKKAKMVPSEF
ncbi:protein FIP2 [Vitis riparia]|uniref:protein FIP2 n=1 Tax=Vitis riparia TaxID=96939 RepID=UPI00155B0372|nr:protein FIP2 [Vitis riparia]